MRNSFLSAHRRDRFHASLPEQAFDCMPVVEGGQDQAVKLWDIGWALGKLSPGQHDAGCSPETAYQSRTPHASWGRARQSAPPTAD